MQIYKNINIFLSVIAGLAIGTGWMTSLRIYRFGISELCFIVAILFSSIYFRKQFFSIKKDYFDYLKIFFIFIFIFSTPINTFFFSKFGTIQEDYLIYLINLLIFLSFFYLLKNDFLSLRILILVFLILVIFPFYYTFIIWEFVLDENYNYQFKSLANNPNQICFYVLICIFFIFFLNEKFALFILPFLIFIGHFVRSEAFTVSIITFYSIAVLLFIIDLFPKKHEKKIKLSSISFMLLFILIVLILDSLSIIKINIIAANFFEGVFTRFKLIENGLIAILDSPIFGHGVGSFGGTTSMYMKFEIHNTFLDFAAQFGIIFSIVIFLIFLISMLIMIIKHEHYKLASLTSILIFLQFHYFGRHFIFYFFLAFLTNYIIVNTKELKKRFI